MSISSPTVLALSGWGDAELRHNGVFRSSFLGSQKHCNHVACFGDPNHCGRRTKHPRGMGATQRIDPPPLRRILATHALIPPGAWNRNSPKLNFRFTEF